MAKVISPSAEFDPKCLIQAAVRMDKARKAGNKRILAAAVDHNKKLWADIHSLVARPNNQFPKEICSELNRLYAFVWSTTKSEKADINDMVVDTLINIDLQISEGLLRNGKP